MSENKRYYWMKLKETFMTSDTIDYFMSQPSGANYVVLYQMLCLKTINTNGRLSRQIGEIIIPYDIPKIKRDLKWFSEDTIRVALNLFMKVGLIYEDVDGTLVLTDHENLVGSETRDAIRKRKLRTSSQPALSDPNETGGTSSGQKVENVPPDIDIDIDKDIDTDIEKDKEKYKEKRKKGGNNNSSDNKSISSCAESQSASAPPAIVLLLNDKSEYPIFQEAVDKWAELYPAVNIMQELRKMAGWLDANPKRRKTKQGILRFVNAWLSKAQDQGGSSGYRGGGQKKGSPADALDVLQRIHDEEETQ